MISIYPKYQFKSYATCVDDVSTPCVWTMCLLRVCGRCVIIASCSRCHISPFRCLSLLDAIVDLSFTFCSKYCASMAFLINSTTLAFAAFCYYMYYTYKQVMQFSPFNFLKFKFCSLVVLCYNEPNGWRRNHG